MGVIMKRLYRSFLVSAMAAAFLGTVTMQGMLSEDITVIVDDLKKEYAAHDAHKELVDVVAKVKKTYKIDIPVIVLQDCQNVNTTTTFSYTPENKIWFAVILLSKASLYLPSQTASYNEQFSDLLHELGHVVDRGSLDDEFEEMSRKESYSPDEIASQKYKDFVQYSRKQEIVADSFREDFLIKENRIDLLYWIAYSFLFSNYQNSNIDWEKCTHPSYLSRAKRALQKLQQCRYSIYDANRFPVEMRVESAWNFYFWYIGHHPELNDLRACEFNRMQEYQSMIVREREAYTKSFSKKTSKKSNKKHGGPLWNS